ncbi:MAG: hypothetical protein E6K61_04425 [Nitrospirae bacterium]|nr:MAG: hypothetical protein E6K61_04425 [Nitrospirota bacterium]
MPVSPVAPWFKRSLLSLALCLTAGLLVLALYGAYLSTSLALPKSEDHKPLLVYGAPFLLKPDLHIGESRLIERLIRLGYHPVSSDIRAPGEYRTSDHAIDIYLHDQPDAHIEASAIRLALEQERVARITLIEQAEDVFPVHLEPQLISGVRGESRQVREWLPLASIPRQVIETVLTVEDRRFYEHHGIDPIAVARAIWANVVKGGLTQGGSTITQQLAKNLFYSPQRTFTRKLKESVAALVLEAKYRKDDILESYLNEIYLGQAGSISIYGIGEAARRYFGKSVRDLTIAETALIAGMVKGPNTYSPVKSPSQAIQRRNVVLSQLRERGTLSDEQWITAIKTPLKVSLPLDSLADAPYFVDYLLRQSEEDMGATLPEGAKVYTTLDPVLQQIGDDVLKSGLAKLEAAYPALKRPDHPLQGALLVLDPKTGGILAMVGGRIRGTVTVRTALEQSLNVPAVRIAQSVGIKGISRTARELGIRSPLAEDLSMALGSSVVSLLEMTSAFGALSQGGLVVSPTAIRSVLAENGDPLWHSTPEQRQAVSPEAAYLATSLMKGVVERGTAAKARTMGLRGFVAGKTGTTDGYRDAWFVGYTPDLVIGVWVGFDDEQALGLTGSQAALPLWTAFARRVIPSNSPDFAVPPGVVTREIDPTTGQLATSQCPERIAEVFMEEAAPTVYCEVHGEGFWERLRHSFGM